MTILTQDTLKSLLHYDPDTGVFTWLVAKSARAQPGAVAQCHDKHGYIVIRVNRHLYKAHRLAWLYVYGVWPNGEIDHINRIRDDNKISNIRESDRLRNTKNTGPLKNNTSGVKGVSFHKHSGLWHARIYNAGKCISLGVYHNIEDAAKARFEAEERYGYARTYI